MSRDDLISVGKGALIAAGGAVVAYLSTQIPLIQEAYPLFGPAIGAVAAVAINAARKWFESLGA